MKKISGYIIGIIILGGMSVFFSCKKKEFPVKNQIPDPNDIMYFKGSINNQYLEIKLDNPEYKNEVSYVRDSLNVYEYGSSLVPASCSSCWEIYFTFRDNQVSPPGVQGNFSQWMLPGLQVKMWNQKEQTFSDTSYVLGFNGWANVPNVNYSWSFGDGGISYSPQTSHAYNSRGKYAVKFFVYHPQSQVQAMSENMANISHLKKNFYYYIKADSINTSQLKAYFSAKSIFSGTNSPVQFLWNVGYGYFSAGQYIVVNFVPNNLKNISLMAIRGSDTVITNYQLAVNSFSTSPPVLTSNFFLSSYMENTQQGINLFLKQAGVGIKTPDGKMYHSRLSSTSNANFNLEIQQVEEVPSPLPDYKAKKVKFVFNANLVNTTNYSDTLKIRNAESKLLFIYLNSRY